MTKNQQRIAEIERRLSEIESLLVAADILSIDVPELARLGSMRKARSALIKLRADVTAAAATAN